MLLAWRDDYLALACLAFDSEPVAQRVCRSMAEVNGVGERVTVMGNVRQRFCGTWRAPARWCFAIARGANWSCSIRAPFRCCRTATCSLKCTTFFTPTPAPPLWNVFAPPTAPNVILRRLGIRWHIRFWIRSTILIEHLRCANSGRGGRRGDFFFRTRYGLVPQADEVGSSDPKRALAGCQCHTKFTAGQRPAPREQ